MFEDLFPSSFLTVKPLLTVKLLALHPWSLFLLWLLTSFPRNSLHSLSCLSDNHLYLDASLVWKGVLHIPSLAFLCVLLFLFPTYPFSFSDFFYIPTTSLGLFYFICSWGFQTSLGCKWTPTYELEFWPLFKQSCCPRTHSGLFWNVPSNFTSSSIKDFLFIFPFLFRTLISMPKSDLGLLLFLHTLYPVCLPLLSTTKTPLAP